MTATVLSAIIFILMFIFIITDKIERYIVALAAGASTLIFVFGLVMKSPDTIFKTMNIGALIRKEFWFCLQTSGESSVGINWATIIFIAGMMIMVEFMAESGFFKWLCMEIARMMHYRASQIFTAFMFLSAFLSMFIDSITVILFLASITIELSRLLRFDPVPVLMAEIFCANLGGAATMCGDPPNVIIGTSLGYTFGDFIENTGILAVICLIVVVIYFKAVLSKKIVSRTIYHEVKGILDPKNSIKSKKSFVLSIIIFALAVSMLITHAQTGLTVATIGTTVGIMSLIFAGSNYISILKKLDYKTILFFIGLFIVVGGLEETGVLSYIASWIEDLSGGNHYAIVAIVLVLSAVASAFVDNIPFAATMIPVIKTLSQINGIPQSVLAWTLAMGTDIGGSATPIGASANVVGIAIAEKKGHHISWKTYCGTLVPVTIIVILISMIYLFVRYL